MKFVNAKSSASYTYSITEQEFDTLSSNLKLIEKLNFEFDTSLKGFLTLTLRQDSVDKDDAGSLILTGLIDYLCNDSMLTDEALMRKLGLLKL